MTVKKKKSYTANVDMNVSFDLHCKAKNKTEAKNIFYNQFIKKVKKKHLDFCIDESDW